MFGNRLVLSAVSPIVFSTTLKTALRTTHFSCKHIQILREAMLHVYGKLWVLCRALTGRHTEDAEDCLVLCDSTFPFCGSQEAGLTPACVFGNFVHVLELLAQDVASVWEVGIGQ